MNNSLKTVEVYEREPYSCVIMCRKKPCEKTTSGTFDICKYGITFYNENGSVRKKSQFEPLVEVAKNLRHELNPILQVIVEEAGKIDSTISRKHIDVDNPASKIFAATIIIDHYIQMISGVNEFHINPEGFHGKQNKINLNQTLKNYFYLHSIVKERGRAKNLKITVNEVADNLDISIGSEFIEFIISILMDNVRKYSVDDTQIKILVNFNDNERIIDLSITNHSKPINSEIDIFQLGVKADPKSKGFGYGLCWANNLIYYYNQMFNENFDENKKLKLIHTQEILNEYEAIQTFKLYNLIIQ